MSEIFISNFYFCAQLPLCIVAIFILWKIFGKEGLFVFISLTSIIANIQVLKTTDFFLFSQPIALGTIVFSTSFLVVDMIVEFYGSHNGMRAILLSFFSMVFFFMAMQLTIYINPSVAFSSPYANNAHYCISTIFSPSIRIVFSGVIAFFISLFVDLLIYSFLRKKIKLSAAISSFVSSSFASTLDNLIFTILAFSVFAYNPIGLEKLFYTYILNITVIRIVVSIINSFILKLWCKKHIHVP